MQLFCAAACFLLTSFTSLQASKLAYGSDSDACYAAFLRSLTETFRGLNSCICAQTSCFLKVAILHHFPSRAHLCLLRCVSSFTYGNIQRLEQLHLRSDELISEASCCTPLPFLNMAVLVAVIPLVHLRYFLKAAVLHYFPS